MRRSLYYLVYRSIFDDLEARIVDRAATTSLAARPQRTWLEFGLIWICGATTACAQKALKTGPNWDRAPMGAR